MPISSKSRTQVLVKIIDQAGGVEGGQTYALGVELDTPDRAEVGRALSTLQRAIQMKLEDLGFFERAAPVPTKPEVTT